MTQNETDQSDGELILPSFPDPPAEWTFAAPLTTIDEWFRKEADKNPNDEYRRSVDGTTIRYQYSVSSLRMVLTLQPINGATRLIITEFTGNRKIYIMFGRIFINGLYRLEEKLSETSNTLPPIRPMSARAVITAYAERHRNDPMLTLKAFCEEIGANYNSIRAAKSRYAPLKKRGRKRRKGR